MLENIIIKGAREHNLKDITVEIPHRQLTVISGVSGSGKSTLAFDTLYAEGQRRYIESLSTYAKQFLERIARPDVDEISGISPSIAIEQKNTTRSARSTVGTATEIYDYLRLLFARIGKTVCPDCKKTVIRHAPDEVIDDLIEKHPGTSFFVVALVSIENGSEKELVARLLSEGYARIMVEGEIVRIDPSSEFRVSDESGKVKLVLDRCTIDKSKRSRLLEAIETSYQKAGGSVLFVEAGFSFSLSYTDQLKCSGCGRVFEEPKPLLFSFNTPYGACPFCRGFGSRMEFDERLIVSDPTKSIEEHAVEPWSSEKFEYFHNKLLRFCRSRHISIDRPFKNLSEKEKNLILNGEAEFVGVIPFLEEMRDKTYKRYARFFTRKYLSFRQCRHCMGGRLRKEAYFVRIAGRDIRDISAMKPAEAFQFLKDIDLSEHEKIIVKDVLVELKSRLKFMLDVGLYYVTLDRLTRTLSGGEAQRINLANSLGANLVDILFVLDEPSIGLHPRDTKKLVKVLFELRNRGNTVVVVEHDLDIIARADYLVDLGPGAGDKGGEVLYQGKLKNAGIGRSRTLKYLKQGLPLSKSAKKGKRFSSWLELRGVAEHNLKEIDVAFPLGALVAVTGVSGSGKSTLVCDVLYQALRVGVPGYVNAFREILGRDKVSRVMMVDQSPIGKSARSNPITYIKAFAFIRDIFSSQKLSMARGYRSGRFSFNVPGGRCNHCQGLGYERVEMHFMADLFVPCSECYGKRFNEETLEVLFRGKNLAQVLEMTVDEAAKLFGDYKPLVQRLDVLKKVGLGYIRLGQPSATLSGGESQRMKIARELSDSVEKGGLYILDEPTTGLHINDVDVLVNVLRELVDRGNTVIVIEHNPQVILQADYVIDLGPEGGDDGGEVVASGTPEELSRAPGSHTGAYLRRLTRRIRKGKV
jgi:excinuclease ABC subunit A